MNDTMHGFEIGDTVIYTGTQHNSILDRIGMEATVIGPGDPDWGYGEDRARIRVRFRDGYTTAAMRVSNLQRKVNTPSTHRRWNLE